MVSTNLIIFSIYFFKIEEYNFIHEKGMKMDTGKTLFSSIVENIGIMTSRISFPVLTNRDFPDLYLRSNLFGEDSTFSEDLVVEDFRDGRKRIYLISDDFKCNYILGRWSEGNTYRMVGPYLYGSVDPVEIRRSLIKKGMKDVDLVYLSSYYHDLPVIRDENLMLVIIQAYCVERFGSDGFEFVRLKLHLDDISDKVQAKKSYSGYQMERRSEMYAREDLLMQAISEGNYNKAASSMQKLRGYDPEYRSLSTLRDMKNYSVILATICRLAAHKGGAHAHDIDRYSSNVARLIENCPSTEELKNLRDMMIGGYCELVNKARDSGYSISINQVTDYINSHYEEDLTLSSAAERFNMSQSYLSSRFHRETGMTFSEYITEKRLEHAKTLLKGTEMTIGMIAEDCGISDNNYFSRVFRRKEGMTPLEYRQRNRKKARDGTIE